jgi:NAD(P)H-hydrate epimerase
MRNALKMLLENTKSPMVIDADALNILSENKEWINEIPENSILTPHPGEFDRLTKKHENALSRLETQIEFARQSQVIVVLKGAYTSIATPQGKVYFNSTGNPGMATAGSGDALTGIILSLLAQGYKPKNAAITGVYLHGLAGDLALRNNSEESLIADDIILNLGDAFNKTRK